MSSIASSAALTAALNYAVYEAALVADRDAVSISDAARAALTAAEDVRALAAAEDVRARNACSATFAVRTAAYDAWRTAADRAFDLAAS